MRRTIIALAVLVVFAAGVVPAMAAAPAKKCPAKPAAHKKVVSAVCPVMGTKIPDVTKAAGKSVYKGKTYYFCCPSCKPAFDKNPEKYTKKSEQPKKKQPPAKEQPKKK